jgi:FeS assembly SUF system protein
MGVRKHYDRFVQNFLTGNEEPLEKPMASREIESEGATSQELEETSANIDMLESDTMEKTTATIDATTEHTDHVSASSKSEGNLEDSGLAEQAIGELELRERVISALREVYDPEIPVNVYDLGLIYRIEIDSDNKTSIDMTLTSPNCPVAGSLPQEVENAARSAEGIGDVAVELVWDPPWDMDRIDEAAKLELGLL